MTTVSMTFLSEHEVNHFFVVSFLYAGLCAFLLAVVLNGSYNKAAYKWTRTFLAMYWLIFAVGFLLSLVFATTPLIVTIITTGTLFLIWIQFIQFYLKNHKKTKDPHKIY